MSLHYMIAMRRCQVRKAEAQRDFYKETDNFEGAEREDAKIVKHLEKMLTLELLLERRGEI